jgi:hypothetical protein
MLKFVLILLGIWLLFVIIGFIWHALLWLAIIGIVLFVLTLVASAYRRGAKSR